MVETFFVFFIMYIYSYVLLKELFIFPRTESYIPGMAFLLGFYQQHERNAKQEVSASVVAASADSVDLKIKFPEVLEEILTSFLCKTSKSLLHVTNVDWCIYTDVSFFSVFSLVYSLPPGYSSSPATCQF